MTGLEVLKNLPFCMVAYCSHRKNRSDSYIIRKNNKIILKNLKNVKFKKRKNTITNKINDKLKKFNKKMKNEK